MNTAKASAAPSSSLVLDAFEARAALVGIKAVVMAELASELRMSTKTLYRHYPTKADLVDALVARWVQTLVEDQEVRINDASDPVERIKAAAHTGLAHIDRFCSTFWSDLRRDYPEQNGVFVIAVTGAFGRAGEWIARELRPGLSMDVAGPLLMGSIRQAADPEFCDRAGVTRREAVDTAIDIWAGGALRPGGRLAVLPDPTSGSRRRRSTKKGS